MRSPKIEVLHLTVITDNSPLKFLATIQYGMIRVCDVRVLQHRGTGQLVVTGPQLCAHSADGPRRKSLVVFHKPLRDAIRYAVQQKAKEAAR